MVSVAASYYPKTLAFEGFKLLLDICLADRRILSFWYALKSIHKFIIKIHDLQWLFVTGSNKKKGGVGLFRISQKERLFISYDNQVFLGVISLSIRPSCTPNKRLPLLFSLGKKRIYLDTQLKGELTDLFWKLPECSLFLWVGIWWWALLTLPSPPRDKTIHFPIPNRLSLRK